MEPLNQDTPQLTRQSLISIVTVHVHVTICTCTLCMCMCMYMYIVCTGILTHVYVRVHVHFGNTCALCIPHYIVQVCQSVNKSVARSHDGNHGDNITDRDMEPLIQRTTDTLNTYYRRYVM